MNVVETIFEKYKFNPSIVKRSNSWFLNKVSELSNYRINKSQLLRRGIVTYYTVPGNLYLFYYDPKHKETLPYYDRFPLVFPFTALDDGFIGLNMHYLPYKLRITLFDSLLKFRNTRGLNERTKLQYSWGAIKALSTHHLAQHCVKRYLRKHVMSDMRLIEPTDWTTTLMLPVESFVKAKKTTVWNDI